MKVLNELIQVLARFNTSGQKEYKIKAIQSWCFGKSIWANNYNRIYQVCTEDDRIAELEWIIGTSEWKLLKM
jgi:hypothetical protein